MATSNTTNLNLIKETSAEPIVNHRGHFNDNMDLIDAAYNILASRSRGQQTWGNLKQNTTWGELIGTNVVAATTTTDNLELIQPGYDSTVDVESFNDNMSILDSTIGAIDVTNDGSIADQLSSVRDSLSPRGFAYLSNWGVYKQVNTTIELLDSIVNYKFLLFICGSSDPNAPSGMSHILFLQDRIGVGSTGNIIVLNYCHINSVKIIHIKIDDNTHVRIIGTNDPNLAMIRQIIGVK